MRKALPAPGGAGGPQLSSGPWLRAVGVWPPRLASAPTASAPTALPLRTGLRVAGTLGLGHQPCARGPPRPVGPHLVSVTSAKTLSPNEAPVTGATLGTRTRSLAGSADRSGSRLVRRRRSRLAAAGERKGVCGTPDAHPAGGATPPPPPEGAARSTSDAHPRRGAPSPELCAGRSSCLTASTFRAPLPLFGEHRGQGLLSCGEAGWAASQAAGGDARDLPAGSGRFPLQKRSFTALLPLFLFFIFWC